MEYIEERRAAIIDELMPIEKPLQPDEFTIGMVIERTGLSRTTVRERLMAQIRAGILKRRRLVSGSYAYSKVDTGVE